MTQPLTRSPQDSKERLTLWRLATQTLTTPPRMTPSEWAKKNRNYPSSAGRPGPRDPWFTPYVVPFCNAIEDPTRETVALVCGSQMGKTDAVLDMIGWRLDTRSRPSLYVGPSKDFITDQFEPRVMSLIDEAPTLKDKVVRGKRMKRTRKVVGGVPLRLAWAGSATQLSSDQAGDIHVDELDRMGADVKGEGDPLTLVKARGFTYRDRKILVTSTPKRGAIDTETDEASGFEFWRQAESLESPIWQLWQSGTRHHWAWPCPHCGEYFIPRFKCLKWPEKSTPEQAKREAHLLCERCGGVIEEKHKSDMNAAGVYVAPGQSITTGGRVRGEPPVALTLSFWVSGLASPFVSFGERAAAFLEAIATGDQEKVQGVINTGFGELYAPGGGEAPEFTEVSVKRRESAYKRGEMPGGVVHPVLTVDVQANRLIWVIRGWGARSTSWLIDCGTFWGATNDEPVWTDLAQLLSEPVCGIPLKLALIDSGFRPDKPIEQQLHRVYDFCRRFPRLIRPTKGSSTAMRTPIIVSRIEVNAKGKAARFGLDLVRLDTDHWKSWVHERIRWPGDQPGAWHLPIDVDDDYCHQLISEARVRRPSGRAVWVKRSAENHFFDCEAMQAAAGFMLGTQRMSDDVAMARIARVEKSRLDSGGVPPPKRDGFLGPRKSIW